MQPPTPPPLQCPADSIYYSTYICPSGSTCILPDADICANTMIVQPSAILETNNSNIIVLGDFVNYGTVYGNPVDLRETGSGPVFFSSGAGGIACGTSDSLCIASTNGINGIVSSLIVKSSQACPLPNTQGYCGAACGTGSVCGPRANLPSCSGSSSYPSGLCFNTIFPNGGNGGNSASVLYNGYLNSAGAGGGGVNASGGSPLSTYSGGGGSGGGVPPIKPPIQPVPGGPGSGVSPSSTSPGGGVSASGGSYTSTSASNYPPSYSLGGSNAGGGGGASILLQTFPSITYGNGGRGGGRIIINATNFYNYGIITAAGSNGTAANFPGGGGGGGYIFISALNAFYSSNTITAAGGNAGYAYPFTAPDGTYLCAKGGGGGGGIVEFAVPAPINSIISNSYTSPSFTLNSLIGGGVVDVSGGLNLGNYLCDKNSLSSWGSPGKVVIKTNQEFAVTFNAVSSSGNFGFSSSNVILTITANNGQWSTSLTPLDLPYEFVVANGVKISYAYNSMLSHPGGYSYGFNSILVGPSTSMSGSFIVKKNVTEIASYMQEPYTNCQKGICQYPVSIPITTSYPLPYYPISVSKSSEFAYSPVSIVNSSNSANAIWLLTEPYGPQSLYIDNYLFQPYPSSYTGGAISYISGNPFIYYYGNSFCNPYKVGYSCPPGTSATSCSTGNPLNPTGVICKIKDPNLYCGSTTCVYASLNSIINYDIVVKGSSTSSVSIANFSIDNIGTMNLTNLGYSPLVDNTISNGFNTKSYVYQQVPSFVQHGLWTWSAKFADLQASNTQRINYFGNTLTVTVNVNNYPLYYNAMLGNNGYLQFSTPILPYLLYNFSMPSPGSLLLPMHMNMSYDIFGPWNYANPTNTIEPFPIDTGSRFFVNYNGVLANSNPNEITKMPWINFMKWHSQIPNINQVIPNYISPSINGIISIAATPNNYIYVLNYSQSADYSQGAYFLTMLRLIPKGYYNTTNYQPNSVGSANSVQQWDDKWNSYWANVIALQNSSVYVVNNINLNKFNGSFLSKKEFTPLNISVDNFGDVFITGYTPYYGPALAEITNTLVNNNWVEVYNSIVTNSKNQVTPEIAVSPTGSLIFLANQSDGGYIYVYSSTNFTQINKINLAYAVYAGGSSGAFPLATLNIYSWLSNNGLYNQSLRPELWWNTFFVNNAMVLDSPEYHHPLGLADINGYLYVLDEWAGGIGVSYTPGVCWSFSPHPGTANGVFFNILTLRVFNSTGSNIPINPSHFNDMYTIQTCGQPYYLTPQNAITPNTCNTLYSESGVSCSNNCELVTDSCTIQQPTEEGHVLLIPGYTYNCVSPGTQSSTYYSLAPPYYSTGGAYPPYGWILAANITGAQLTGQNCYSSVYTISNAVSINFCGSNSLIAPDQYAKPLCNFNPVNLNPANYNPYLSTSVYERNSIISFGIHVNYYNGTYYPIGPQLRALAMNVTKNAAVQTSGSEDGEFDWVPKYNKIGFSVNFNDSIDILFPNSTPKNPLRDIGDIGDLSGHPMTNPNIYKELIFTRLNVENYTKLFGGLPPYSCFTNASFYANTICGYLPGVEYMNPPVYTATDAFKFLESLGSPSVMPIESVVYSTTSGNGFNSNTPCSNAIAAITNGLPCGSYINPNAIVPNSIQTTSGKVAQMPLFFGIPESLSSKISGYSLIPYEYSFYVTNGVASSQLSQVFTYQTVNAYSNNFNSAIEGGDTYLRYSNGKYYVPNLSDYGTILPKNLLANLLTDRNFTNIYVNITNQNGLYQTIVNGSKTANFIINQYYIGSQPVYATISSVPKNDVLFGQNALEILMPTPYGVWGCYLGQGTDCLGQGTGYYYNQLNAPSFVQLFDWYKMGLFTDTLDLYLNQSPLNPNPSEVLNPSSGTSGPLSFNARGYTRLIYVLNDRFNNTIYLPIDADIANITQIRLNVNPVVDPSNVNQTTLYITGNATYFDGVKYVPLAYNSIYIYFNNNINYMQYNALLYPVNAVLCAYNSMASGPCTLANPAFTSLSSNSNIITYYPQYNALGECGPPPAHLFIPPVYNCNIYGNGLPAACNSTVLQSGQTIKQWCIPLASNGTGICTSQIGLMGIATTDQNGNFKFSANACGIGTASITAEFYGYPYNEPITVTQPYLSDSATLYYTLPYYGATAQQVNKPPANLATFQVLNFMWSPNETTVSHVNLGRPELSYGSISIIWLIGLAAVAVLLMYLIARFKKD
jgi:hypothetical protein